MSASASPRSTLVFSGWQFPMLPSRAVNIYIMLSFAQILFSTRNSFTKSLPDLANLFRLKELIIWMNIIWHVILLIRTDGVLQRSYDGTGRYSLPYLYRFLLYHDTILIKGNIISLAPTFGPGQQHLLQEPNYTWPDIHYAYNHSGPLDFSHDLKLL